MRTRSCAPSGQEWSAMKRWAVTAAATASPGSSNATKNSSPRESISEPERSATASRTRVRCSMRAGCHPSASRRASSVDPSRSVKKKVTVPVGSSGIECSNRTTRGARLGHAKRRESPAHAVDGPAGNGEEEDERAESDEEEVALHADKTDRRRDFFQGSQQAS